MMFESLEQAHIEALQLEADQLAGEKVKVMDVAGYRDLVELGVEIFEKHNKLEDLKLFVDKGVIDKIAIEAMQKFGQMDLLKINPKDLDRSLEGQIDIIEASSENMITDSYTAIVKWITKVFQWIDQQLKAFLKFFYDVIKNINNPLNPKYIEEFYDRHREIFQTANFKVNVPPLYDIEKVVGQLNVMVKQFIEKSDDLSKGILKPTEYDSKIQLIINSLVDYVNNAQKSYTLKNTMDPYRLRLTQERIRDTNLTNLVGWCKPESVINLVSDWQKYTELATDALNVCKVNHKNLLNIDPSRKDELHSLQMSVFYLMSFVKDIGQMQLDREIRINFQTIREAVLTENKKRNQQRLHSIKNV